MKKLSLFLIIAFFTACTPTPESEIEKPYSEEDFEGIVDGKETHLFTLENSGGMLVTLTNYGAKIVSVYAPDRSGDFVDVVLGFNSIEEYQKYGSGHGAVVGPFANRIANAQFTINGETYELPANNSGNSLHSGPNSWYRKVWDFSQQDNSITFTLESPDGEFGFPGNKTANVTYTLTEENELKIDYQVTTDKPTHINLTNHAYFNLQGEGNGDILDHVLVINADSITQVDDSLIPTGEIVDITGTDVGFTTPHTIGERINADHPLIQMVSGYDFNYVINKEPGELAFCAGVFEPESGRYMEVFTTEPGVQLYTSNRVGGNEVGNRGNTYGNYSGLCLETQHYPDSPNHPDFPSTLVTPEDIYQSTTIYKFSVRD